MKRENPQLKQIEGLVKELLEREGLTAEGGPWGWLASELLAGPAARGGGAGSKRTGNLAGDLGGRGPCTVAPIRPFPSLPSRLLSREN